MCNDKLVRTKLVVTECKYWRPLLRPSLRLQEGGRMGEIQGIRLVGQLAEPISHFTDGVRAGDMLWISGMIAVDAEGALVGAGDVVAQAEQVFRNLEAVLTATGATFTQVVKVVVYLRDIDDRPRINPVRQRVFGAHRPASTLVEVSRLAHPDALVEIDAVAYLGD
jgi:2-iminobutanoate/2-iminopropanoate deaminase